MNRIELCLVFGFFQGNPQWVSEHVVAAPKADRPQGGIPIS
ncbi:MAG TPA: hypothetical protein P5307_07345 [Pirellulaceae bacterium]|nr:hypothetical protein [Pirellulaceae bacterium]